MILVDASVWIDHLRGREGALQTLLDLDSVLCHPLVIGELVMGNLQPREMILRTLQKLPHSLVARHDEVLNLVEAHSLFGLGLSCVDAHLLAAVQLTSNAELETRDKRMLQVAERLEIGMLGSGA